MDTKKRNVERSFTPLMTEQELDALRLLSKDDLAKIFAGEEIVTAAGVGFSLQGKGITVGDSQVGVIVTSRKFNARTELAPAVDEARKAAMRLNDELKTHKIQPPLSQALTAYFKATKRYQAAMLAALNETEYERKRAVSLAAALPGATRTAIASAKARARHKNDPAAAAKVVARNLWPEAHRKGWTAAKFHTELSARGETVPFDTARKWLTSLRKSGTC